MKEEKYNETLLVIIILLLVIILEIFKIVLFLIFVTHNKNMYIIMEAFGLEDMRLELMGV